MRFFFFNDTATTEIYTLSLHDALPISQLEIFANDVKCTHGAAVGQLDEDAIFYLRARGLDLQQARDRKSTRLNSSHGYISYAVFCLKKKKKISYKTM